MGSITSFDMHPDHDNDSADFPDIGSESSFPERHFTPFDEKAPDAGVNLGSSQLTAAQRQMLEPGTSSIQSQSWPDRNGSFLQYNLVSERPLHSWVV